MRLLTLIAVVAVLFLGLGWGAGRFLVVDAPERSDVLIVLAGDHNDLRYKRGLQLLAHGYAPVMLADASIDTVAFGRTPVELEQEFIHRTAGTHAHFLILPDWRARFSALPGRTKRTHIGLRPMARWRASGTYTNFSRDSIEPKP